MLFKALFSGLCFFISVTARPQVTTVLPFGIVDNPSSTENPSDGIIVSGVIIGTGADGTTYAISGPGINGSLFTATIVENDSSARNFELLTGIGGVTVMESGGCGFSDGSAICTEEVIGISGTLTVTSPFMLSGPVGSITVVVSTASAVGGAVTTGFSSHSTASATDSFRESSTSIMTSASASIAGPTQSSAAWRSGVVDRIFFTLPFAFAAIVLA